MRRMLETGYALKKPRKPTASASAPPVTGCGTSVPRAWPDFDDRSSRPETRPHAVPPAVQAQVIELRHSRQTYRQISQQCGVSQNTIARWFKRAERLWAVAGVTGPMRRKRAINPGPATTRRESRCPVRFGIVRGLGPPYFWCAGRMLVGTINHAVDENHFEIRILSQLDEDTMPYLASRPAGNAPIDAVQKAELAG